MMKAVSAAFFTIALSVLASGQQAPPAPAPERPAGNNWPAYFGDYARTHYSTLTQITKSNVPQLRVAWSYATGDMGGYQSNPVIVDGVLYTRTPTGKVIALDAATGADRWTFDPKDQRPAGPTIQGGTPARGLALWDGGSEGRRIFASAASYLYCLDARTGQVVHSFGKDGAIHLGEDLDIPGATTLPAMALNTPGVVYKDLLIIGSNPGESGTSPPGHIRAYDVRTGKRRWIFHTIPHPGEPGYETWPPEYYKAGAAANNWAGLALDQARGIVYVPTGSPGGDFWGENRWGSNLYADSLIALDANTGRRIWHFQAVHHDLWDRDFPTPPVLMTVMHDGRPTDIVAQGTKIGRLFVFNRVTGEPLWPIEERPVPQSTLPGVRTWPTQPFPTKPPALLRERLTEADATTVTQEDHASAALRLKLAPNQGPYPAPSVNDAVMFPGFDGGMEWGGAAADRRGILYVNVTEMAWGYQMVPTRREDGSPVSLGQRTYMVQCATCHGIDRRGDAGSGIPALTTLSSHLTKAAALDKVTKGGGGRMSSFSELPEGQRRAIVDYLFGDEQPETAYAPATPPRGAEAVAAAERAGPQPYVFRGFQKWVDSKGYPAINPPWGTLNAVDLNTGEIKWKVPLGEYPELTARGIPPTGRETYGGPVVTAAGLLFIASTGDEMIRAFDTDTGRVLWQAKLPFRGYATPSVYAVNGKQYVVISAGGRGANVVAFALP